MRQQADYLRESIERINRVDPQPGEMDELRARRDRIENAAEIAEGVTRALGALDASQVADDVESASAADLIDRASQALRAIHVEGVFSELADRLDSISTDLSDVVFSLSGEVDNEASVEDLDAINGRIHELDELTRRWGPELSDVITWRDKAVYDLEDLDASPEKVERLEAERAQLEPRRRNSRPKSPRNLIRWPWALRNLRSAWRNANSWTPPERTTSNSSSPRFPAPPSCRWAKARPAAN